MKEFVRRHEARIQGALSCLDRMLFGGCLPNMSGWPMAQFLRRLGAGNASLEPFFIGHAERVQTHPIALAEGHEQP